MGDDGDKPQAGRIRVVTALRRHVKHYTYEVLVVCHMLDTCPDAFWNRELLGHTVWLTLVANTRHDSSRHIWMGTGPASPDTSSPTLFMKNPAEQQVHMDAVDDAVKQMVRAWVRERE